MSREACCGRINAPLRLPGNVQPVIVSIGGFTLIELIITLGMMVVLSTAGWTGFQRYIDETRADTIILNLRTALNLARTEAITRSESIVLCRLGAVPGSCAGSSASGQQSWSLGWLLFLDKNRDKAFAVADGDDLLRVFPAVNSGFALKWNRGDYVAFQGSGRLHSLNGTFCLAKAQALGGAERELKIPFTGRVRQTSGECSYSL